MRRKRIKIITASIGLLLVLASVSFTHKYKIIYIKGASMEPSLHKGQLLIANKQFSSINYSDIIVVKTKDYGIIIKRIAGMSGDKVNSENDCLKINDLTYQNYHYDFDNEIILKENELFVIGDNYNSSVDSREFGPVHKKNILAIIE